jgi:S1-C subfamily serine protease
MTALTLLLGAVTFHTLAPVPPALSPDPTGRGYVGVTIGEGSVVSGVEPRTPAAQAGLRPGDVIVRVGTLVPANYEQVIEHICAFRPGAVVEVEVQRGSERKVFKIKLACRPLDLDRARPGRIQIDD